MFAHDEKKCSNKQIKSFVQTDVAFRMLRPVRRKIALYFGIALFGVSRDAFAQITIGEVIMNVGVSVSGFMDVLNFLAWVGGSILAVSGLMKLKDHVDDPHRTHLNVSVRRFIAGGFMLSLPFMGAALQGTMMGFDPVGSNVNAPTNPLAVGIPLSNEIDDMVLNFMNNITLPTEILLSAFTYLVAVIFLFIGITRLTRRMEDGPRGPAGFGTIMTFITSAVFFTMGDMAGAVTNTLFDAGGNNSLTSADMTGLNLGLLAADQARVENVIQAVMYFIMIVGIIAFIRGWFVIRAFAEGGSQNATLAQGLTFLIGGALAINMGALVNAIENTLNIPGIAFY